MKIMNRKSFWTYAGWGVFLGLAAVAAFHFLVGPAYVFPNPAFVQFEKVRDAYEDWSTENKNALEQSMAEQVIAGIRPHTDLRGSWLEGAAERIHRLNAKTVEMNATQRAAFIQSVFDPDFIREMRSHVFCGDSGHCVIDSKLSVLNDRARLALLLDGSRDGLTPGLPTQVPGKFDLALDQSKIPPKILGQPRWLPLADWTVFAVVFAVSFFLIGLACYSDNKDVWSHPFRSFPDFVIGWLIIVLSLPTLLAGHILRLMTLSVGPAFVWVGGVLWKSRSFDDDFSEVEMRLRSLRESAQRAGSGTALERIDAGLERVRGGRDRSLLIKLRAALDTVEGLEYNLSGVDELDQHLRHRT